MKWAAEAEEAIARVPFFVRRRVRRKVEEEAARCGAAEVCLEHVRACQQRFLYRMEEEVRGYQVETCFGPSGCPNRAGNFDDLAHALEEAFSRRNLKSFLKARVGGPLKMHHEFRASVSDCPNACSRPQIADLGLIGARTPRVRDEKCSGCGVCVTACREEAISLVKDKPVIEISKCLSCGQCISVCPTEAIEESARGYRILIGGRLGRHPRLALEIPGIHGSADTLRIVERCLDHYQRHCSKGERFGEILEKTGIEFLKDFGKGSKR